MIYFSLVTKSLVGEAIEGVVVSEGASWTEQRRFMVKNLTELGMGKKDTMENVIWNDAQQIVESLMRQEGKPVQGRGLFLPATNNVIWSLATGDTRKQDDPLTADLTQKIVQNFENMSPSNLQALLSMNSLTYTRLLDFFGFPNVVRSTKAIHDMIRNAINRSHPDDSGNYIERGLAEIEKGTSKTLNKEVGKAHLLAHLSDMFIAGTDTTSGASEWCLAYLVYYPKWQERLFDELSTVTTGNARRICLADREFAHATNAFIEEVFRHSPMGLFPPPHKTLSDTMLDGKRIPKGTQVMYSLYSMHRDPKYYKSGDEDTFRPERFLDSNGEFKRDLCALTFFGLGKRRCPGEHLARAEVFMYMGTLVQSLQFDQGPDGPPNLIDPVTGLVMYCQPFSFLARKRSGVNLIGE